MHHVLSHATKQLYQHAAKPLLFKLHPDGVHRRLIRTGSVIQRSKLTNHILRGAWAYQNPKALSQTIHGITFSNPIGLSAGFDKNFQLPPLLKSVGFGFMEGGSLTLHECAGNPGPWFHRLPKTKGLVVNAGLANQGVDRIISRLAAYLVNTFTDFPLNISVAKTNSPDACSETAAIADYIGSLKALKRAKLGDIYTLNISCPNTYGGQPFTTPELLEKLLTAVDAIRLSAPVFIKMPAHLPWKEFKKLADVAAKHSIAGLTISNLVYREQIELKDPLPGSVKGKISGAASAAIANNLIFRTRQAYGDHFIIIGVGGVFNAADAYEKIKYGANLVELITGMIFEGPQMVGQINEELVALLKKDGLTNIGEAVGVAVSIGPGAAAKNQT
ncbi:MAG: quinone-dependent dihydroorotate dehydrogenase [Candidatus Saccharibacteria bacterium]|nr:MAG: quinone-dependent dihydroorotate dehydrogenase [Candidatus Saccharibacteria bacterium]